MHLSLTILFNVASCNMRNVGVERERFLGRKGDENWNRNAVHALILQSRFENGLQFTVEWSYYVEPQASRYLEIEARTRALIK